MKKKLQMKTNKIEEILNKIYNWNPSSKFIIIALLIFALFSTFIFFELNGDFWFLINTGKYILNNGFPVTEPFTVHSDLAFIAQQWLTDIIFYFIYDKFDIYGMLILVTIVNIFIIMLIYKICTLIAENRVKFSFIITILVSSLLNIYFITTRPHIFDILFLLLELYLLELYIKNNNKLYLIGLPIISLLMINLHASMWLMLFVFILPYIADNIIKIKSFAKDKYSIIPLIITTIIMLVVGLINPYGIDSITYIFGSYGIEEINSLINEMKPVTISSINGIMTFAYILFILFSCYLTKGNKIKLRYLLLFFGTCYLGLSHNKGMVFLFIGGFLLLVYNFKHILPKEKKEEKVSTNKLNNIILVALSVISISIYMSLFLFVDIKTENKNDLEGIIDYLDSVSEKAGNVYTNYNDGGYVEYRGYKCYLDPRAEVFLKSNNKKEDIFDEYVNLQKGRINYKEFLNKYNFDYLIVNNYDLLYAHVNEEDGYTCIYDTYSIDKDGKKFGYRIYKRINNEKDN